MMVILMVVVLDHYTSKENNKMICIVTVLNQESLCYHFH